MSEILTDRTDYTELEIANLACVAGKKGFDQV